MDKLTALLTTLKGKERNYEAGKYHCHVKYSLEQHEQIIKLLEERVEGKRTPAAPAY